MPERGQFADHTAQSGLGGPTYQTLTFGTDFVDSDNDGYPDLFLANGHVEPNIEILDSAGPRYAQHDQLFLNKRDGTFTDVTAASGLTAFAAGVGRGSAAADYDNDGDVDLFVSNNNQRPHLLRNDGGNRANWISVEVEGRRSNRSGIGTRVTVFSADLRQMAEVRGGSSYLSHNDLRLHFGLGRRTEVDRILIRWPSGESQTVRSRAGKALCANRRRRAMGCPCEITYMVPRPDRSSRRLRKPTPRCGRAAHRGRVGTVAADIRKTTARTPRRAQNPGIACPRPVRLGSYGSVNGSIPNGSAGR